MTTFYPTIDVSTLAIEKLLCLPFWIDCIELEIEYSISKYIPATFWHDSEGGTLDDWNAIVSDGRFNDSQIKKIMDAIPERMILDAIWLHHEEKSRIGYH